ncbi:hypothetical protein VCO01S_22390 [Vibrio comitans NBRC 102076]|uniref:HTH lysR-type domain-containing protein n=1 Tax=Vibrio comitans NBRC 102076 TaxID=1219078 RepID=A0A4Y3INR0_9VIBR|nr:hypothetical protein VCO01S_22390 [Vibrio comitans NBRC 102076]
MQRLRDTFDDPLFTRVAKGLVPTSKALELGEQLPAILKQLNTLVQQKVFDPKLCTETFSISMAPFLSTIVTPRLLIKLLETAPLVNLVELPLRASHLTSIEQGSLDFSVHYKSPNNPQYQVNYVGKLPASLFARFGHPLFKLKSLSVQDVVEYPIIGMQIESDINNEFDAPVDKFLNQLKPGCKTKLRGAQTQVLIDVMLQSDALLFGADALTSYKGHGRDFKLLLPVKEWFASAHIIRHSRNKDNDAYVWFEKLLEDELRNVLES